MIAFFRRLVSRTKLEWAVIVVIVVILIALLLPEPHYVWDGDRVLPVLVEVYDATTGQPIAGTRVTIFKARFLTAGDTESRSVVDFDVHEWTSPKWTSNRIEHGTTNADGWVRLQHKFDASGSYDGRTKSANVFLSTARVCVTADGYGGVVVPVRHGDGRIKDYVEDGRWKDVYVQIGLFRLAQAPLQPVQAKQPSPNE